MGSRRKRKSDRLTAGAAGVARQARDLNDAPLASARNISPGASPSSASRRAITPSSTNVRAAAKPHAELSTSGDAEQLGAARSDSQRQARVGLVTKQTDDGSYELVYEALDAQDHAEPDEELPTPPPWWRQRGAQMGLFAVIGLLFIGVTLAFVFSGGDEQSKPRKVAANNNTPPGSDSPDKEKPRYEYVAPTNPEGQLNDEEDLDDDEAPTTTAAKRPAPPSPPPKDQAGALNANPPTPPPILDKGKLSRVPSLDLRPNIPSGSTGGIRPDLNPRTRDLLGKRLNDIPLDPTGAPIESDDEGDDDEGDDDEGDEGEGDDEGDDDEGDDDEGDDDEGDDDEGDDDESDDDEGDDDEGDDDEGDDDEFID